MNRPKYSVQYGQRSGKNLMFLQYVEDLEKYCDELEKASNKFIDLLSKVDDDCFLTCPLLHELIDKYKVLENTLDKACKEIVFDRRGTYKKGTICPIKGNWCVDTKACWQCLKEWLKDME